MDELTDKTAEKQQKRPRGRPFKPGESGNPEGRPKGTISITAMVKQELKRVPPDQKITYLELLVKKILKKAIVNEDKETIKLIWNYVDGMPKQAVEYTGQPFKQIIVLLSGKVEDKLGKQLGEAPDSTGDLPRRISD